MILHLSIIVVLLCYLLPPNLYHRYLKLNMPIRVVEYLQFVQKSGFALQIPFFPNCCHFHHQNSELVTLPQIQYLLISIFISPSNINFRVCNNFNNQFIMLKISILFSLLAFSLTFSGCQPFGVRLYYGKMIKDPTSTEKAVILFNTKQECSNSFAEVRIVRLSRPEIHTIDCITTKISTSKATGFYQTFVQRCSIHQILFEKEFDYSVFGWQGLKSQNPYNSEKDKSLPNLLTLLNLTVQSSWPFLLTGEQFSLKRESILQLVTIYFNLYIKIKLMLCLSMAILHMIQIQTMGQTIKKFLALFSTVASKIPVIHVPGNHERNTEDANLLFIKSFELYGVDRDLATGISFGPLYLIPFDPYAIIYNKTQQKSSLAALKYELQMASQAHKFTIPFSHYPLICSAAIEECHTGYLLLDNYFDLMIRYGVSLHVGAHTHTYERNYPYFMNQKFVRFQSPYRQKRGYLISIVEGVAGSDRTIVDQMPTIQPFTAQYTLNQTGFGIITAQKESILYTHFSTSRGKVDEISILRSAHSLSISSQ